MLLDDLENDYGFYEVLDADDDGIAVLVPPSPSSDRGGAFAFRGRGGGRSHRKQKRAVSSDHLVRGSGPPLPLTTTGVGPHWDVRVGEEESVRVLVVDVLPKSGMAVMPPAAHAFIQGLEVLGTSPASVVQFDYRRRRRDKEEPLVDVVQPPHSLKHSRCISTGNTSDQVIVDFPKERKSRRPPDNSVLPDPPTRHDERAGDPRKGLSHQGPTAMSNNKTTDKKVAAVEGRPRQKGMRKSSDQVIVEFPKERRINSTVRVRERGGSKAKSIKEIISQWEVVSIESLAQLKLLEAKDGSL